MCHAIFLFLLLFCTPPPTDQKSSITLSTSNTTTAHTQMDLPFVGVQGQGHQKPLENTKTLIKIDVFLCLVVQEPGVYRGGSVPPDPPFLHGTGPPELGAGVLGQIKYRALPAAFDVTEVHRGTPIGPALCRAVLGVQNNQHRKTCLLYTSPSPRDRTRSRMPSSA